MIPGRSSHLFALGLPSESIFVAIDPVAQRYSHQHNLHDEPPYCHALCVTLDVVLTCATSTRFVVQTKCF